MTNERRNGRDPNRFSRERRAVGYGGQIPLEWDARLVDVDAVAVVPSKGALWLPYEQVPGEAEIVAVIEHKRRGETRGSQVTQRLARDAGLPWYLVEDLGDRYLVVDTEGPVLQGDIREVVRAIEMPRRLAIRARNGR